jgi:hypothetical protein
MRIEAQRDLQQIQRLAFCYLCARAFTDGEPRNRDHVPNTAIFAVDDRQPALILPTHVKCNHDRAGEDEVITQLLGVLRGRKMVAQARRPTLASGKFPDGTVGVGALAVPLRDMIFRWVTGFHAALYREPLGPALRMTFPPLPEGQVEGERVSPVPVPEVVREFVLALRRNRMTGTVDQVISRNGKCLYECVWEQADDGRRICIWALDVYDWKNLGDTLHFEPRGCVGSYAPEDGRVPPNAALATRLHIDLPSPDALDPFA